MNKEEFAKEVLGMTSVEAHKVSRKIGIRCRLSTIEGKPNIAAQDIDPERINLNIVNGVVASSYFG